MTTTTTEGPIDIALREAMEAHATDETAKSILASTFTVVKMVADGVDAATAVLAGQLAAHETVIAELREQVSAQAGREADAAVVAAALYQGLDATRSVLDDVLVQIGWASRSEDGGVTLTEDCPADVKDRIADAAAQSDDAMEAFDDMTAEDDEAEAAQEGV